MAVGILVSAGSGLITSNVPVSCRADKITPDGREISITIECPVDGKSVTLAYRGDATLAMSLLESKKTALVCKLNSWGAALDCQVAD